MSVLATTGLEQVPALVKLGAAAWETDEPLQAVFFVPYDPAPASANRTRGQHWSARHRETETAQQAAMWAYRAAGDPVLSCPVVVDLLVFRSRTMDDDNAQSGLKHVTDYLFKGRALPDDSRRWLTFRHLRLVTTGLPAGWKPWTVYLCRAAAGSGAGAGEEQAE